MLLLNSRTSQAQPPRLAAALLAFASLVALGGCAPGESATKSVINSGLKDPDSAQFKEFRTVQGGKIGCISVNAKNSYGGYAGYELMAVEGLDTSYPKEVEVRTTNVYELCSEGAGSDRAYAQLQCNKLLERIRLWKKAPSPNDTEVDKQKYAAWLEQDISDSKKWCPPPEAKATTTP
jgi:hypothetical protein